MDPRQSTQPPSRPRLSWSLSLGAVAAGLAMAMNGCSPSPATAPPGSPGAAPADRSRPPVATVDEAEQRAREQAQEALERATTLQERALASGSEHEELLAKASSSYENAQAARFNSKWRAARELYLQAAEFYSLVLEMDGTANPGPGAVEDPRERSSARVDQPIAVPDFAPDADATAATVAGLFAEVDRVQRMAYTGGGLQVAPELVKAADAELWDAQIADAKEEYPAAAGHLKRIVALYSEAYRQTRMSSSATGGASETASGPVRWADSFSTVIAKARGEERSILLLLYDQVSPHVVGLFADDEVCAAAERVLPCKHRVTEILSGVDPAFLSDSDRRIGELLELYSIRSFPVLMLLDARGEYVDSIAEISDRDEILALLEEAD